MAELDLIPPTGTAVKASFALEPAYNAVNDLLLIGASEDTSGFDEWVYQTARLLPLARRRTNWLVLNVLCAAGHLAGESWPSFPTWVEHLSAKDPHRIRDVALDHLSQKAGKVLGQVPPAVQILHDRSLYLSALEQLDCYPSRTHEPAFWEQTYDLLHDPPALRDQLVTHLHTMWNEVLSSEWERNRSTLEEVVAAFGTLDLSGMSGSELIRRVTGRDLSPPWEQWQAGQEIVFVPSPHIGPYIFRLYRTDRQAWIAFRAYLPEGVATALPALTRSELLMRLSALADDTRLRILELFADHDELNAQQTMDHLGLSQSSASRHLTQLSASGYLAVRRHEGVKWYRLNRARIDDTLRSLKGFL